MSGHRFDRPRQALIDAKLPGGCPGGSAARLLQNKKMKLSGDLSGDFDLQWRLFRAELIAARPAVLTQRRGVDLQIEPQFFGRALLEASGNQIIDRRLSRWRAIAELSSLGCFSLQRESTTILKEIGNEIVGKSIKQMLLVGVATQIPQRRDGDSNARQQAGPG
ncbi:MAG: hypothetical protein JO081_06395 [Alphaproteobacteria bacterium]|nr:hypothetical protein [Alphaproteobacteria bacterium]